MSASRARDAVAALSLANLCLLEPWALLFAVDPYYLGRAATAVDYLGPVVAELFLASAFYGVARLVRRAGRPALTRAAKLCVFIAIAAPAYALARVQFEQVGFEHLMASPRIEILAAAALVVVVAALALTFRRIAWRATYMLLLFASPFVLLTFGRAIMGAASSGWSPSASPSRSPEPSASPSPSASGDRPRVLWIVLDELDQRITFEARPASLVLPELDRLAAESFRAERAYPPGPETMISIPALTTGRLVAEVEVGPGLDLQLKMAEPREVVAWSASPTVFSRAREDGHVTRVVGWGHAYCDVLGASLSSCSSWPSYYVVASQARPPTLWGSAAEATLALLPWRTRRSHARALEALLDDVKEVAVSGGPGLVFAHLPVPHTPGIYDRASARITYLNFLDVRGYLDNLALADRALGELRRAMEGAGVWGSTTLIVSADHGWRDSAAFDGATDIRVPFLVKLAGSAGGAVYSSPFNTLLSHDLALALLRGQVKTNEDLAAFLDARRTFGPSPVMEGAQQGR